MSNIILLESREADRSDINGSVGDWQTIFSTPVLLEDGDEVLLKTAVIDTVATASGSVILTEDVVVNIEAMPYVINFDKSDKAHAIADFGRYFPCLAKDSDSEDRLIVSYTFRADNLDEDIPAFNFTVSYNDLYGTPQITTFNFPGKRFTSNFSRAEGSITINLPYKGTDAEASVLHGIPKKVKRTNTTTAPLTDATLTPIRLSHSFTVPAGTYTPDDICSQINRSINRNVTGTTLLNSAFFKTSEQLQSANTATAITVNPSFTAGGTVEITSDYTDINGESRHFAASVAKPQATTTFTPAQLNISAGTLPFMYDSSPTKTPVTSVGAALVSVVNKTELVMVQDKVTTTGAYGAFQFGPTQFYVGASQFEIDFNTTTNKFEIKYLHTPFTYQGAPSVLYQADPLGDKSVAYSTASAFGGVAITKLEPESLWGKTGKFGFDTTAIHATVEAPYGVTLAILGQGGKTVNPLRFNAVDGQQTTTAFVGADSAFDKNSTNGAVPTGTFYSTVNADQTISIPAVLTLAEANYTKAGYFLVDIEGAFRSTVLGPTNVSHTMAAIVSRYYSTDNYTTGDSSSGLLYTHVGEPQLMQSMRVRVLEPDGSLSTDIGNDNTVFLQVVKGGGK